jgi:hypothetical protein
MRRRIHQRTRALHAFTDDAVFIDDDSADRHLAMIHGRSCQLQTTLHVFFVSHGNARDSGFVYDTCLPLPTEADAIEIDDSRRVE